MIKKSIYIMSIALLFTGCAERGSLHVPMPKKVMQESNTTFEKDSSIPTLVINARQNKINTLENKVSGTLILLIGLALFL